MSNILTLNIFFIFLPWETEVKGLEEIDISIGIERIHVHGEKAEVEEMSTTGTLKIILNLPEYMRIKVG